mmetsp:Transcript_27364/g.76065  ORF Transcript_27364/g.76065 Transcript_27364/m.76065 type:complete len:294 (-) Transcript_27364:8-889(-)
MSASSRLAIASPTASSPSSAAPLARAVRKAAASGAFRTARRKTSSAASSTGRMCNATTARGAFEAAEKNAHNRPSRRARSCRLSGERQPKCTSTCRLCSSPKGAPAYARAPRDLASSRCAGSTLASGKAPTDNVASWMASRSVTSGNAQGCSIRLNSSVLPHFSLLHGCASNLRAGCTRSKSVSASASKPPLEAARASKTAGGNDAEEPDGIRTTTKGTAGTYSGPYFPSNGMQGKFSGAQTGMRSHNWKAVSSQPIGSARFRKTMFGRLTWRRLQAEHAARPHRSLNQTWFS